MLVLEEINELSARKDKLEANINRLNTEAGIEEELRRKFQIKKPGEEFIVIIEDNMKVPITISDEKDTGFWNTTRNFINSLFE